MNLIIALVLSLLVLWFGADVYAAVRRVERPRPLDIAAVYRDIDSLTYFLNDSIHQRVITGIIPKTEVMKRYEQEKSLLEAMELAHEQAGGWENQEAPARNWQEIISGQSGLQVEHVRNHAQLQQGINAGHGPYGLGLVPGGGLDGINYTQTQFGALQSQSMGGHTLRGGSAQSQLPGSGFGYPSRFDKEGR